MNTYLPEFNPLVDGTCHFYLLFSVVLQVSF